MAPLSDQQLSEAKEAFTLFDKDNDGCITTPELGTVMRALGKNPTEAEVFSLAKEIDPDTRGIINLQGEVVGLVWWVCEGERLAREMAGARTLQVGWGALHSQHIQCLLPCWTQQQQQKRTEFLGVLSRDDIRSFDSDADIRGAWKVFDKDNKGWIEAAELRHVLANIGEKLSGQELEEMIKEADPDGDGKIQRDEFVRLLTTK